MPKTVELTPKERLDAEPKVSVRLPVEHGADEETATPVIPVCVNGVYMQIARGDVVEIPAPMYLALRQTGKYDI